MRTGLIGTLLILCAGCASVPQWDSAERLAAESELENASTQVEMTGAAGGIAILAEKQLAEALDWKLSTLSGPERRALLLEQFEWQRRMDRRNAEPIGGGSIAPMQESLREEARLKNRFEELTVPEDTRRAFVAMREAPVRFHGEMLTLDHGELIFQIPAEKWEEGMPETETVAQLNIPFCREVENGTDRFLVGVIEPTNYNVVSSFGLGTEQNLCIWKDGEFFACHLIGKRLVILGLEASPEGIEVSFRTREGEYLKTRFPWTPNSESVRINHWTTEKNGLALHYDYCRHIYLLPQ